MTLGVYRQLARLRWPKSYLGKFLVTAFLGVHLPLIAILLYVAGRSQNWAMAGPILLVGLCATLLGTLATLAVQHQLLRPMLLTTRELDRYVQQRAVPSLPLDFTDEAGQLMRNAQTCIAHLDKLLTLKNDLLAVISHDIRAPVASIVMASQMIDRLLDRPECDVDQVREFNRHIQALAHRQIGLMNNLLTLARSESGTIALQPREIGLDELLGSVAATYRLQAEQKGLRLTLQPPLDPRRAVCIDAVKTEQVLNNLVHNAIKFTPAGGTVELGGQVADEQLTLYVRDTGTGMEESVRANLFSPFTHERRSGTAGEAGTGLGLWICKTFTELQGGAIEVRSQRGQGTCFEIRLPLAAEAREQQLALMV